jgi:DNA polymerase I-like protein with 3'-5' exonuclease and polymerase domains
METIVLDLETSIKCPIGNNKANPMWLGNSIVAVGYEHFGDINILKEPCGPNLYDAYVVGQNIKFDLLYCYRYMPHEPLPSIWDTQLAEYIITGQQAKYASLDQLTRKYVGEHAVKDDKVKEYWDKGINTEDIPWSVLAPYLRSDVENTSSVFEKQWKIAEEGGQLSLILVQMDALRATTAMNLAGMAIDWEYVDAQKKVYDACRRVTVGDLPPGLDYTSPKQLSLYFFGGEETVVEKQLVGTYKNGNDKYKNVDIIKKHDGLHNPASFGLVKGKNGYYSVDDHTLDMLVAAKDITASTLKVLRTHIKIADTYYKGLQDLRFPSGYIYPQLNHCATSTGRLSCTAPNLQNQTDIGDVKRAFISRHGKYGSILELDYSQLEMVWLAYIADDKVLQEDINSGRDMHRELYKEMYGRYPTDAERKPFKRYSFLLVYGGGASTLVAQSGCTLVEAKKFIKTFYNRYKGVKKYHETIVEKARSEKEVYYEEGKAGPRYSYLHKMPWGRHYRFNSYLSDYTGDQQFSPTELKNYMIQGSATGDMVPLIVGILQRKLEEANYFQENTAKMVMTVHDSIVLDCHDDVLYDVARLAKQVMEDAPTYIKDFFNIDFPCKLSVGVEAGPNWQDMINIKDKL